jgi:hypothetical protein
MIKCKPSIKAWLAASAVIVIAALGLTAPTAHAQVAVPAAAGAAAISGHASATASGATCYYLAAGGGLYLTYVYYPSVPEYDITESATASTCWTEVNEQSWTDPISGETVQAYELETDGLCLETPADELGGTVLPTLDTCTAGDADELNYLYQISSGIYWIVSESVTSSCILGGTDEYGALQGLYYDFFLGNEDLPNYYCLAEGTTILDDYWWITTTQSG